MNTATPLQEDNKAQTNWDKDERERKRYMRIAWKFQYGGQVTAEQAETFMGWTEGRIKEEIYKGNLHGVTEAYGEGKVRTKVDAHEVRRVFGTALQLDTQSPKAGRRKNARR